jgi:hypothetical protein
VIDFELELNTATDTRLKEYKEKIKELASCDSETRDILADDIKVKCEACKLLSDCTLEHSKFLNSPFISKINLESKEFYVSTVKSQLENNIIL